MEEHTDDNDLSLAPPEPSKFLDPGVTNANEGPYIDNLLEEFAIGVHTVTVSIPRRLIQRAVVSSERQRVRIAGVLAAHTIDKYTELTGAKVPDPVAEWNRLRDKVLDLICREDTLQAVS